jgi:hypothetical protein
MIVEVWTPTAQQRDERSNQIRRNEERPPAFGLADVDAFVRARGVEAEAVAGEDDMAEGHGGGAAFEERAAAEEQRDDAAVDLEDAVHDLRASAGEECERQEREPEGGRRRSPEVDEDARDERAVVHRSSSLVHDSPHAGGLVHMRASQEFCTRCG